MHSSPDIKIVIVAGGTGGHIFPALAVAHEISRCCPSASLLWIGTNRNREQELCKRYAIPLIMLSVSGIRRAIGLSVVRAVAQFVRQIFTVRVLFSKDRPSAVIAFGGYVSAPVLCAAFLKKIPYFCHEQNTVPGLVNRVFARFARQVFLSFPLAGTWKLHGKTMLSGMPVRSVNESEITSFSYPSGIDKKKPTVLVTGGSQGALKMNECLVDGIRQWAADGIQVIWQMGDISFQKMAGGFAEDRGLFCFRSIDDLYPYYRLSRVVVCRSGASTLAEAAYFGLPCVMVPLPWSTENHQWTNAGLVEAQGWGIRVKQDESCKAEVYKAVIKILSDKAMFEHMSQKSLDNSPHEAASIVAKTVLTGTNV